MTIEQTQTGKAAARRPFSQGPGVICPSCEHTLLVSLVSLANVFDTAQGVNLESRVASPPARRKCKEACGESRRDGWEENRDGAEHGVRARACRGSGGHSILFLDECTLRGADGLASAPLFGAEALLRPKRCFPPAAAPSKA